MTGFAGKATRIYLANGDRRYGPCATIAAPGMPRTASTSTATPASGRRYFHSGPTIDGNVPYENVANGLDMDGVQDLVIENNVIYNNGRNGVRAHSRSTLRPASAIDRRQQHDRGARRGRLAGQVHRGRRPARSSTTSFWDGCQRQHRVLTVPSAATPMWSSIASRWMAIRPPSDWRPGRLGGRDATTVIAHRHDPVPESRWR